MKRHNFTCAFCGKKNNIKKHITVPEYSDYRRLNGIIERSISRLQCFGGDTGIDADFYKEE